MSIFFRICPHDQQTCRDRDCCRDQIDGFCPKKVEKPATVATTLPVGRYTPLSPAQEALVQANPCTCGLARYCAKAFGGFCAKATDDGTP